MAADGKLWSSKFRENMEFINGSNKFRKKESAEKHADVCKKITSPTALLKNKNWKMHL